MKTTELTSKRRNGATSELDVRLPAMDLRTIDLRIIGTSSLLCHAWSARQTDAMKAKHAKQAKQGREVRDPEAEYKASMYYTSNGAPGFPASAFKNAAVDACSHIEGVTKVEARGAFHIIGDIIPLIGTPRMHEHPVKVGMGGSDLRYRAEFTEWSCDIRIRYNASVLSAEQIVNLFNVAGFAIGVGDWRPQRDGSHGMFQVGSK